jgi:DNA-binding transcriptional ArsR family regulator
MSRASRSETAVSQRCHGEIKYFTKGLKMDDERVARSLGALSQVHRLKAFRALVVAGRQGMTPGVLSEQLGISPASMSFHLKELLFAGLVSQSREGRNLIYRASFDRMNDLLGFLTANCCEGQPCELEAPSCNC